MSVLSALEVDTGLHEDLRARGVPEPKARMAAVAMNDPLWQRFKRAVVKQQRAARLNNSDTLLIGAGFHGTIFANNWQGNGLDVAYFGRPGGVFGVAAKPVFYLNSRTRRGDLATPGESGTLNYMPGCVLQPSDISGAEYPSQDVLAKCISLNLDQFAGTVRKLGSACVGVQRAEGGYYRVNFDSGGSAYARRVIIATGVGAPHPSFVPDGQGVLVSFLEFLGNMGRDTFPLEGLKRVAVIGAGDSGKVAVEFLLGQGPRDTPAALDFVERIDWYGVTDEVTTAEDWERCNRSRYKGIARYFPRPPYIYARIDPLDRAVDAYVKNGKGYVVRGFDYDEQLTNGPYDLVVDCRGFINTTNKLVAPLQRPLEVFQGIAKKVYGEEVYVVGPAADIPTTPEERKRIPVLKTIAENSAAMFRYAPWPAQLARYLSERK